MRISLFGTVVILLMGVLLETAVAHHILGRPAYNLNEDSNTPSSVQADAMIGDYMVTYMIYPAYPKPGEAGRINLYIKNVRGGAPYQEKVTFSARPDAWYNGLIDSSDVRILGEQPIDDHVYRQTFKIVEPGPYLFSAEIKINGEAHVLDFPLMIGAPPGISLTGIVVGLTLVILIGIGTAQRRRTRTGQIRGALDHNRET
jgi:hypothetical protein